MVIVLSFGAINQSFAQSTANTPLTGSNMTMGGVVNQQRDRWTDMWQRVGNRDSSRPGSYIASAFDMMLTGAQTTGALGVHSILGLLEGGARVGDAAGRVANNALGTNLPTGMGNSMNEVRQTASAIGTNTANAVGMVLSIGEGMMGTNRNEYINGLIESALSGDPWISPIVAIWVQTVEDFAKGVAQGLMGEVVFLLNILFALWLLVQCVKLFFGMGSSKELFFGIMQKSLTFIVLITLMNASQFDTYWKIFLDTPVKTVASFASTISISPTTGSANMQNCSIQSGEGQIASTLGCLMSGLEGNLRSGVVAGAIVATNFDWELSVGKIVLILVQFALGVLIIISFALSMLYYAFVLMEFFMLMALIVAMGPLLLALYVTPITRQYPMNALRKLVGNVASLLGLCIAGGIISYVLAAVAGSISGGGASGTWVQAFEALKQPNGANLILPDKPAFWMLFFAGISIIGLGRSMVRLLSTIFGSGQDSVAGDKAVALAKLGGALALAPVAGAAALGGSLAAKGAMAGGASGANMLTKGAGSVGNRLKGSIQSMSGKSSGESA